MRYIVKFPQIESKILFAMADLHFPTICVHEHEAKTWDVRMNGRIYPFDWIEDAIKFADMFKGELMFKIESI